MGENGRDPRDRKDREKYRHVTFVTSFFLCISNQHAASFLSKSCAAGLVLRHLNGPAGTLDYPPAFSGSKSKPAALQEAMGMFQFQRTGGGGWDFGTAGGAGGW